MITNPYKFFLNKSVRFGSKKPDQQILDFIQKILDRTTVQASNDLISFSFENQVFGRLRFHPDSTFSLFIGSYHDNNGSVGIECLSEWYHVPLHDLIGVLSVLQFTYLPIKPSSLI